MSRQISPQHDIAKLASSAGGSACTPATIAVHASAPSATHAQNPHKSLSLIRILLCLTRVRITFHKFIQFVMLLTDAR
jgi:hypothetical protein